MSTFASIFICLVLLGSQVLAANSWFTIGPKDPHIHYLGRTWETTSTEGDEVTLFGWSGTSASLRFEGTSIKALISPNPYGDGIDSSWYKVYIDGVPTKDIAYKDYNNATEITLAEGLSSGIHTVLFYKRTEVQYGSQVFQGFSVLGNTSLPEMAKVPSRRLEFIGNSITCGYGSLDQCTVSPTTYSIVGSCPSFTTTGEDHSVTYAAVAAQALGAEEQTVCWSGKGLMQNTYYYNQGPTAPQLWEYASPLWETSDPATEPKWNFQSYVPHAVMINLGTNDFSHPTAPDSVTFVNTYVAFINRIHTEYGASVPVVLLHGPMVSDYYPVGVQAATKLSNYIDAVITKSGGSTSNVHKLIFTENKSTTLGVGADWHPNKAQHTLNGGELESKLRSILGWVGTGDSIAPTSTKPTFWTAQGLNIRSLGKGNLQIQLEKAGELKMEIFRIDGSFMARTFQNFSVGIHRVKLPIETQGQSVIVRVQIGSWVASRLIPAN